MAALAVGLPLASGLLAAALAWRLTEGPVAVPAPLLALVLEQLGARGWVDGRVEATGARLSWAGWREGLGAPLVVEVDGPALTPPGASAPAASAGRLTLRMPPAVLLGAVVPVAAEVERPALALARGRDGALRPGEACDGPAAVPPPAAAQAVPLPGPLAIVDGHATLVDCATGLVLRLEGVAVRLEPAAGGAGGLAGSGAATLRLGGAALGLRLAAEPVPGGGTALALDAEPFRPAALAGPPLPPEVTAALALADLPLTLRARLALDTAGRPGAGRLDATAGAGTVAGAPVREAALALSGADGRLDVERLTMRLAPVSRTEPAPTLALSGAARRGAAGDWTGAADLALDRVALAELGAWWPAAVAPQARAWIVRNLTAGYLRDGAWRAEAALAARPDGRPPLPRLTALSGTATVADATVHWLRPVPPAEQAAGRVAFGLDEVSVRVTAGRQSGTAVALSEGQVRFTGLDAGRERAEIELRAAGPVADVLEVLRHPRLKLFDRRPLKVDVAAGTADARVTVGFPLLADLPVEEVRVAATGRLANLRLTRALLGRDLEQGAAELRVDTAGLRASGTAQLAGVPLQLGVEMDFRPGPPAQVIGRQTVRARVEAARLATFGVPVAGVLGGSFALEAESRERRDGQDRVSLRADLRETTIAARPLGYAKAAREPGTATAELTLREGDLKAVEEVRVEAPGLLLRGRADYAGEVLPERAEVVEARIGATRMAGTVRIGAGAAGPVVLDLAGPVLDLSGLEGGRTAADPWETAWSAGRPLTATARFERLLLTGGRALDGLEGRAALTREGVLREAELVGRGQGGFSLSAGPAGRGRRVQLSAADAGLLFAGLGVPPFVEDGRLEVEASAADLRPSTPLAGTLELSQFGLRDAPAVGKLLQALTVYGIGEAVQGPGLRFARLTAPFSLTPATLTIDDARLASASLGLTARGRYDRRRDRLDLEGTVVPAYVLNTLLGNLPLVGRLFSAEPGGGLIAFGWTAAGPPADPQVRVNPLTALTPGFLRGLFAAPEPAR